MRSEVTASRWRERSRPFSVDEADAEHILTLDEALGRIGMTVAQAETARRQRADADRLAHEARQAGAAVGARSVAVEPARVEPPAVDTAGVEPVLVEPMAVEPVRVDKSTLADGRGPVAG